MGSFGQMGVGKRAIHLLVVMSLLLAVACSGNQITKAFNTINAVSSARNSLQPIYDEVVKVKPELADEIQQFDAEFHDGILSAYSALAAVQAGSGSMKEYDVAIANIISILERYKIEQRIPELQPALNLIKTLLGVV